MERAASAIVACLALLACGPGAHQESPKARAVAPVVNPSPQARRPFLWRVDGARGASWILGTMHVGVDPHKAFSTALWRRFDESRVLVLEVDVTGPQALGVGMQPIGKTLDAQMSPAQWAALLQALKVDPGGTRAERLKAYRAWVIVAEITNLMAPQVPTIDGSLHERAKAMGKPVAFLEGVKVQAAILDRFATVSYLLELIKDLPGYRKSLAEDVKVYLAGDEQRFAKGAIDEMARQIGTEGMEALLYARNRRWIPGLERHLRAGGAFIAVGNAHLVGERSVVALLRRKGYRVKRVMK